MNEVSWVIRGFRTGMFGYRTWMSEGEPHQVQFPWRLALSKSLIGFWHTHPHWPAYPSEADCETMHAWVTACGHDLLCVITGTDGTRGWMFYEDETYRREVRLVTIGGFIHARTRT